MVRAELALTFARRRFQLRYRRHCKSRGASPFSLFVWGSPIRHEEDSKSLALSYNVWRPWSVDGYMYKNWLVASMTYLKTSKNCVIRTNVSWLGTFVINRRSQLKRSSASATMIKADIVNPNLNRGRSKPWWHFGGSRSIRPVPPEHVCWTITEGFCIIPQSITMSQ